MRRLVGPAPVTTATVVLDKDDQGRSAAPAGSPEVTSVGQVAGLRPRGRPGDGGEVGAADVDLLDALDPLTWRTAVSWLRETPSAATRRTRLKVLAAFLRWLRSLRPALEPLAVAGSHLDAYYKAARAGTLTIGVRTPGKPLADATVARKRAALSSFYAFVWRSGVVRHPVAGSQPTTAHDAEPAPTRQERRLLRLGIARLAAESRPAEAAAVALLEVTGACVGALARLTVQDIRSLTGGDGSRPIIVTVHDDRGHPVAFPIPAWGRPLLKAVCSGRPAAEPLIRRDDGRSVDLEWLRLALIDAARAGGIPKPRARLLHPEAMRATTVAELLRDSPARVADR
jgi:integrase